MEHSVKCKIDILKSIRFGSRSPENEESSLLRIYNLFTEMCANSRDL